MSMTIEELPEVEPVGESTDLVAAYVAPLLRVTATFGEGQSPENVDVEIQDGGWAASPGGLAAVVDAIIRSFTAAVPGAAATYNFQLTPVTPEVLEVIKGRLVDAGEEKVREALDGAVRDARLCAEEHERRVLDLRALLVQAREAEQVADDAAATRAADGADTCAGGC